jgi:endonuclease/exonuclease/phosphatase family metal-dependent hydrolase
MGGSTKTSNLENFDLLKELEIARHNLKERARSLEREPDKVSVEDLPLEEMKFIEWKSDTSDSSDMEGFQKVARRKKKRNKKSRSPIVDNKPKGNSAQPVVGADPLEGEKSRFSSRYYLKKGVPSHYKYSIWNCRGVSKKGMATKVKNLYSEIKADFIGLQETMRKNFSDKFFRLIDPFKIYAWHWLPSTGKSGGILCGIKKESFDIIKVEEKEFAIVAEVQDKILRKNVKLVMVYGPAHDDKKNIFLSELAGICANNKIPTLIGGDFNILRYSFEKNKTFTGNRFTDLFNWIINIYELRDLPLNGGLFTWSNNHSDPTLERLDRVLINPDWEINFPLTNLRKNPRTLSDHNPLILCTDFGEKKKQRQFCFETSWIKHPEFIKKVKEVWGREVAVKNAVEKWQIKLNRVKKFLRGWGHNIKGHTKKNTKTP